MRLIFRALILAVLTSCATSGYSARNVPAPVTDAARDDYAVYSAVIEQLAHVWSVEKFAGGGPLEFLVADQTYTCEGGTFTMPGGTAVARFPRRATRGAGLGAHLKPRFPPSSSRSQASLRVMPIDYLDSFDWLTKAEPAARLAVYFSAVMYLDAARDTAVVQVMSGRTNRDLSCTTWLLERARPGREYRYVRGHSSAIK